MKKGLIFLCIVAVGAVFFIKYTSQTTKKVGVYCSQDGTLSETSSIQSERSYCVKSESKSAGFSATTPSAYSFSIIDEKGNILKNFAITHTKPMHVIVARKDLAYFQHVHPEYDEATGVFSFKDLIFPTEGEYRIFADFAPNSGQKDSMGTALPVTVYEDVAVGDLSHYVKDSLGTEEKTKTFEGVEVTLNTHGVLLSGSESMIMFSLSDKGKPVTDLEPYLGALGHAVVLRENTLDFIHAHPSEDLNAKQTGTVDFMVNFPEAGMYKVFTQFQRGGKIITTNFVVKVTQGASGSEMDISMPGMKH